MPLSLGETKGCCYVAYEGVTGEQYRFPGGQVWSVIDDLSTSITGFKAVIIGDDSRRVVAFAGTDSLIDVAVDIMQVLGGLPPQYSQAIIVAEEARRVSSSNLFLAGHSLGGGLAAYCSAQLNIPASTINPAPLIGGATLSALFAENQQITNYIASGGEIVSSSPGRNPGTDVYVPATGGTFGFFTDHLLANVAPSIPLPSKV